MSPDTRKHLIALAVIAGLVLAAVVSWLAGHQVWVDEHCTMVLGTQVCN